LITTAESLLWKRSKPVLNTENKSGLSTQAQYEQLGAKWYVWFLCQ